jgi:hypothetical protein
MKIGKGSVVSLEYRLHLGDGVVVDASEAGEPLVYLHGESQIVPGLERELEGLEAGASRQVTVAPADGYGLSDTRAALRRHFEIDAEHIVVATLAALARAGALPASVAADAVIGFGLDPEAIDPIRR